MAWQRVVVQHSGRWERLEYLDGEDQVVHLPFNLLSRDSLIREIHDFMETSLSTTSYTLNYLTRAGDGRKLKGLIKTDVDLIRLVQEQDEPTVYVTQKSIQEIPTTSEVPPFVHTHDSDDEMDESSAEEDEDDDDSYESELRRTQISEFCEWIREAGNLDEFVSILEQDGPHNMSSQTVAPDEEGPTIEGLSVTHWMIPVGHTDDDNPIIDDDQDELAGEDLAVGNTFLKKDDVLIVVGNWHMQRQVEYYVSRSTKSRLEFTCKRKDICAFRLYAKEKDGLWRVQKFEDNHTCRLDLTRNAPRKMSSKVMAVYFSKKIRYEAAVLKPRAMIAELLKEYGIEVEYGVALRARNLAIEMVYGGHDKSFEMLPAYLHTLRANNPDQHQSIKNAVARVYPEAHHGFCYYHIAKNHARHGKHLIVAFKKAAYAYRQESFLKYMSMIERNEAAYASLLSICVDHWARSQSPKRRYTFMTSNMAESFNACLLWARRLPICSLIEVVRSVTERWFDKRRELTVSRDHVITDGAFQKLSKQVEKGRHFVSHQTTAYTYTVTDAERSFVVDLQHRTCDCGEFQLDQMPCSHATATIRSAGHNMYDYVEYYYKQVNMCLTYHERVYSVPNDDEWTVPFQQASFTLLPPIAVCQVGRPKEGRYRSSMEGSSSRTRRQQVCSRCGGTGHNKSKCTTPHAIESSEVNATQGQRQPRRCGICGEIGHSRRTCPLRANES
ncbi:hypothetical protein C2S52_022295 [Perilla frutescens var. hirtella]|nr:hypothetical protein C2S52_022295 [Perilla frutescens var. hirtella]